MTTAANGGATPGTGTGSGAAPGTGTGAASGAAPDTGGTGLAGRVGVWRRGPDLDPGLAVALERLGFASLWVGSSPPASLDLVESLLDETDHLVVGTGIVNIWTADAAEVAASFHRVDARRPGRFVLGIGTGHREASGAQAAAPFAALVAYLDVLDAHSVPRDRVVLAALGPRALRLAGDRTRGAHPYLVTPEHTGIARAALGAGPLLVPEQHVVLEADPVRARAEARVALAGYLRMTNYLASWRRLGFTDADFADGGSDRLVDALVAHGTGEDVAARVQAHLDAGADEVAVQLLGTGDDPAADFARLASVLGLVTAPTP